MVINEFGLAVFIMAVGLSAAGAGTHLYQFVSQSQAELSYAGKTYIRSLGSLAFSFICGPYIMLQMGFRTEPGQSISATSMLLASFVAFGWAFITGLLLMSIWLAARGM
ncbi:DUF6949 family protein [Mariluticola halotolerans]|uniref:DUF6949 family protein n=1 Tax=Mariluticola halotolerans TaxID=2909283 RepID=UPI0026E14A62|nr:hypothetical protein [Mariluticola halotolerans]UJQ95340.1 hypothetical protein L1P08_04975 [Mariluticola halotolerans]